MKLCNGAWLPDDESDPVMLGSGSAYQRHKLMTAMNYVDERNFAIDVGGHCGLWAMQLSKLFSRVVAFEPLPQHIECFKKNAPEVELHNNVLGDRNATCNIHVVETLSGQSYVDRDGDFVMMKLDDFDFENVDFLKVDTEGFEYFVLKGAEKTLVRSKPAIIVEQKPGHAEKYGIKDCYAVQYLEHLGAVMRDEIMGDYILSWDKQ